MSIQSPLKLLVGGCSMITSCSVWMFETSNNPKVASMTSSEPSSPGSIKLDSLPAVDKLEDWQGKEIKDPNAEVESYSNGSTLTLRFKGNPNLKSATLYAVTAKIEDFKVFGNSTKEDYVNFKKSEIKISLFKKAAWYSETRKEEYQELNQTEIDELFDGLDEVRVKQLLLALSHKLEWNFSGSDTYNMYHFNWAFAQELNHLKDLKIRHFQEFSRLKEYVKKKAPSCKDDTRACFPHVDEIDYLEVDRKEYFEKAWNSQNT